MNGRLIDLEIRYVPVSFGGEQLRAGRDPRHQRPTGERERELQRSEARLRATVEAALARRDHDGPGRPRGGVQRRGRTGVRP